MSNKYKAEVIAEIIVNTIFFTITVVFRAFTIAYLFNNFVAVTFDIPKIGLVAALGIDLVVKLMTSNLSSNSDKSFRERTIASFVSAGVALLFGWLLLLFV